MKKLDIFLIIWIGFFSTLAVYFYLFTEPEFTVTVTVPKQYDDSFVHPIHSNVSDPNLDLQIVPTEITSTINGYRLLTNCDEFEMYPQKNRILIGAKSFTFNRGLEDHAPILLIINSDDEFRIKKIQVNALWPEETLMELNNVQKLALESYWVTVESDSISTANLFTEKIQSIGNSVDINGFTNIEIRLPDEDFEAMIRISNQSTVSIDDTTIKTPRKTELKIQFSSTDDKSIFFKRDFNLGAGLNSLSTSRVAEPVQLLLQNCEGKLSIPNPPLTIDLHGSESIYLDTAYAEIKIKNEDFFNIDSKGNANVILINGMEPGVFQIISQFFDNSIGIIIGIVGIIIAILALVFKYKPQKRKKIKFFSSWPSKKRSDKT